MKKRIDLREHYVLIDEGQGPRYKQRNELFDLNGWSIKNYPTDHEAILQQEIEAAREFIVPKSQLPYSTKRVAQMCQAKKHLSKEEYHVVDYKGGFAITRIEK